MKPKVISEKIKYQSSSIKVIDGKYKLTNGQIVNWDFIDASDAVVVLPLDSEGNVYLCREWRPAWKDYVIQVPAGVCESQDEEVKLQQVHNELREEIGMDAKKIKKLISFRGTARINYTPSIYLATDLFVSEKAPDDDEFIEVIKMPFKKAFEMFLSEKEKTTGATLLAFLLADQYLQRP